MPTASLSRQEKQNSQNCKGENIIVKVPDFPVEQGRVLEGTIIRSTDNAGTHIVGCRMPEDRIEIGNYVSRNYSE